MVAQTQDEGKSKKFSRRHTDNTAHLANRESRRNRYAAKLVGAEDRQLMASDRSPTEQLTALDKRLGPGVGAKKERARLKELLEGGMRNTPIRVLRARQR